MSKAKEQLAATLVNHWFIVDQILSTGRRKRHPTSSRYSEIASLDFSDKAKVGELIKSFSAFNAKHFIENLRWILDQRLASDSSVKITWSPKILIRGLGGTLVMPSVSYNDAPFLLAAMNFSRQNAEVASAIEQASTPQPAALNAAALSFMIPGFKNSPFANLSREHLDFIRVFESNLLVAKCMVLAAATLVENQKQEVLAGRANIVISMSAGVPTEISVVETDTVRAQRLARERLEELRRRRKVALNEVIETEDTLLYRVSPVIAPEENTTIQVSTETLLGW